MPEREQRALGGHGAHFLGFTHRRLRLNSMGEPLKPGSIQADLGGGQLGFVEGILSLLVAAWGDA